MINYIETHFIKFLIIFSLSISIVPVNAFAHPVAQGSLEIEVTADKVNVSMRASMEQLLVYGTHSPSAQNKTLSNIWRDHADYILAHLQVALNGKSLNGTLVSALPTTEADDGGLPQSLQDGGFVLYTFEYKNGSAIDTKDSQQITLDQNILNEFEFAPGNHWEATYVIRLKRDGQVLEEGRLLSSKVPLQINTTQIQDGQRADVVKSGELAIVSDYFLHGIHHILSGYDHLLFVSALVLATLSFWDLFKIITAFTLAHTITLILAAFNIVRLPSEIVEPIIAARIVVVALQNVFWPKISRGNIRLLIAFLFGLFHGLGFAGGLLDAMQGMQIKSLWLALVSFSVGVEVGHQVVVIPLFLFLYFIRSIQRQHNSDGLFAKYLIKTGSMAISIAGLFYLVAALRAT